MTLNVKLKINENINELILNAIPINLNILCKDLIIFFSVHLLLILFKNNSLHIIIYSLT